MEVFLIIALFVLVATALMDLVVGVGNDAVNFLNSAIGSKVASFKTIMWIATAGILVGALSSAGMMEIAREGIFNPEYFTLNDVIVIFLAVMLTDILLLDAFNTLGLPTSTTVSIIFELLGASLIVASYKILTNDQPMNWLFNINDHGEGVIGYINWSKTNTIISSIFLSIILSFTVGVLVMFLSRVLFGFRFSGNKKYATIIWASIAMLALSYFLIYKGLKSTYSSEQLLTQELIDYKKSFYPNSTDTILLGNIETFNKGKENEMVFIKSIAEKGEYKGQEVYEIFFGNRDIKAFTDFIKSNLWQSLLLVFMFWIFAFWVFDYFKINALKIVVMVGTFSLAMAFAGNDLVNFIGVPLAGWQSYEIFQHASMVSGGGLSPDSFLMSGLKFPIQTPYLYLFLASIVMILTLWFSKKARSVTETEVSLGSQEEIEEKFNSNAFSRWIVKTSLKANKSAIEWLPNKYLRKIEEKFTPLELDEVVEQPAFDLLRASVNLTAASMLIGLATSYKLPLSTTYVSFMVAMGTSLADRAWGRESAAYRIAGVINVIAGWLFTAVVAFSITAIVALILLNFKLFGLIFMVLLIIGVIMGTNYYHKYKQKLKARSKDVLNTIDLTTIKELSKSSKMLATSLTSTANAYNAAINGLINEDENTIKTAEKLYEELSSYYKDVKNNLFKAIKKSPLAEKQTAQLYILSNDLMQDLLQSLQLIISAAGSHVKNGHKPLSENQKVIVLAIKSEVNEYLTALVTCLNDQYFVELASFKQRKRSIFDHIEHALIIQVDGISSKEFGFKNTDLTFSILLETKDLVAISVRFAKLFRRLSRGESPLGNRDN